MIDKKTKEKLRTQKLIRKVEKIKFYAGQGAGVKYIARKLKKPILNIKYHMDKINKAEENKNVVFKVKAIRTWSYFKEFIKTLK